MKKIKFVRFAQPSKPKIVESDGIMFKETFINLCNDRKESPSFVCRKVGIAPATFSCWTDESVPRRATLQRIADYFGVSTDYLLGKENKYAEKLDLQLFGGAAPTVEIKTSDLTEGEIALIKVLDKLTDDEQKKVIEYVEFLISKRGK